MKINFYRTYYNSNYSNKYRLEKVIFIIYISESNPGRYVS